jgi:hypothetical protein
LYCFLILNSLLCCFAEYKSILRSGNFIMVKVPHQLAQRLGEGLVVPFVGAGVSTNVLQRGTRKSLFPNWDQLLHRAADKLASDQSNEARLNARLIRDLVDVIRPASKKHKYFLWAADEAKQLLDSGWYDLLQETFGRQRADADPDTLSVHRLIWKLANKLIITTNFDHSLSWACDAQPTFWNITAKAEQGQFIERGRLSENTLWFLHGNVSDKANTILTNADFKNLYDSEDRFESARKTLEAVSLKYSILFIGCSLRDVYILKTLNTTRSVFEGSTPIHYAIVRKGEGDVQSPSDSVRLIEVDDFGESFVTLLKAMVAARESGLNSNRTSTNTQSNSRLSKSHTLDALFESGLEDACSMNRLFREYVVPELQSTGRTKSTIEELKRSLIRWGKWESSLTGRDLKESNGRRFLPISDISPALLKAFREWLTLSGCTIARANSTVASIIRILKTAQRVGLIPTIPTIRRLAVSATKIPDHILKTEEVQRLWESTKFLEWPSRDENLGAATWQVSDFWRAALVFWLTYGFKTQDMISMETGYSAITWSNIKVRKNPPITGELTYVPQFARRRRPRPIQVPLTKFAMAALDRIRPPVARPDQRVFYSPLSSVTFYATIEQMTRLAGLENIGRALPKALRNTCKHFLEHHYLGISRHVLGLSVSSSRTDKLRDKNGEEISVSVALKKCFNDYDPFDCFSELLPST